MPTYDYVCEACGHELEVFQNISEAPKRKCPACKKSKLKRKIGGGAGFLFKGSGFYLTDYRSDSYKKGESDSKPKDEAKSASSEAKASDAKAGSGEGAAAKESAKTSSTEKGGSKSSDAKKTPKKAD
jgi:putative FmdB family regulatory protein